MLSKFSADKAVELWWQDCSTTHRVNQQPRRQYKPRTSSQPDNDSSEEEEAFTLNPLKNWDRWFALSDSHNSDDSLDSDESDY